MLDEGACGRVRQHQIEDVRMPGCVMHHSAVLLLPM